MPKARPSSASRLAQPIPAADVSPSPRVEAPPSPRRVEAPPGCWPPPYHPARLAERYRQVRGFTEQLCEPLATEDYIIQSMPDVSPTKWHLAHTSWFFETFILAEADPSYEPFHPRFNYLFNSYYNAVGVQHCRPKRGQLSRPTVEEVFAYRAFVDEKMTALLAGADESLMARFEPRIVLGLHHEQQHQELMLTDIKHVFACNPLLPEYRESDAHQNGDGAGSRGAGSRDTPAVHWLAGEEGVREIGITTDDFCFDNETPRHRVFVAAHELASRPVTCGEYRKFMADGGYERPELWLSAGWDVAQQRGWNAPLYWDKRDGEWQVFTLRGLQPVNDAEPVCHVSLYEADAFARWAGARLATEAEWELHAAAQRVRGNFVETGQVHPVVLVEDDADADGRPNDERDDGAEPQAAAQMFGDVWEWTADQYRPYPGYQPPTGALGEYNGKFMANQFVLRGGSCATPVTHIRPTYRNFFPPEARWQFSGIRLARDV